MWSELLGCYFASEEKDDDDNNNKSNLYSAIQH